MLCVARNQGVKYLISIFSRFPASVMEGVFRVAASLGFAMPGSRGARDDVMSYVRDRASSDKAKEPVWGPVGPAKPLPGIDVPTVPPFEPDGPVAVVVVQPEEQAEPKPVRRRRGATAGPRRKVKLPASDQQDSSALDRQEQDEDMFYPGDIVDRRRGETAVAMSSRRLGRSMYDAVQTHGHFGMVDDGGSTDGIRRVVVHVPRRSRGYVLDIRPGDVIHANSGRGRPVSGRLEVQYVTRHQYFGPGKPVTSCLIGIPESQWMMFVE